jgi:excisionase family DNA binding protein
VGEEERFTLAEAARLTGLTSQALARRIERGSLPAAKVGGRRYVKLRDLAAAGLLDPATRTRPRWADARLDSAALARELIGELTARGLRIFELERRLDDLASRTEEQQLQLDEAKRERAELRSQIERLEKRRK